MKCRTITLLLALGIAMTLLMTGCDSDSSTDSGNNWATVDSLDYQIYTGDFSGYRCVDQFGDYMDVDDVRDWVIHGYATRGVDDDDNPDLEIAVGAYPNPGWTVSALRIETNVLLDIEIVVYNEDLSWVHQLDDTSISVGESTYLIDFEEYDIEPGLYRVFVRMFNTEMNIAKWTYGDILYDPDYE